jgi:drug/metabolite transporter (DMT)-like permease
MNISLIIVAIVGWALWSICNRLATQRTDPFLTMMIGMACNFVMVPFYLPMVKSFKTSWAGIGWIAASSICVCTAVLAYTVLAMRTSVSSAISTTALYPMLSFFLAVVFLHESFSWMKFVGLGLMVAGTIFITR